MTDIDPHEVRMAAGQNAAAMLEALNDETIELLQPAAESMSALVDHVKGQGLPRMAVMQVVLGMIVGAVFGDEGEDE